MNLVVRVMVKINAATIFILFFQIRIDYAIIFFIIFYILNRFKQYNNKIQIQIYKNVVLFYYTKNKLYNKKIIYYKYV